MIKKGGVNLNRLIANQIRIYRIQRKMTLASLSERSGIDDTYLGRVERGEINITLNTLEKIIDGLSMTLSEFFSFLDFEDSDKEISRLFREVLKSPHQEQIITIIRDILSISEE